MRARWHLLAVVVAAGTIVVASCGDAGVSDGAADSPVGSLGQSAAPPATRLLEPLPDRGDTDFVPVTALDAGEVAEPCPAVVSIDRDAAGSSAMLEESSRLEPMLGVVLQYGSERPDVFGGYGLHWTSADDASVFVSFTSDVAEHRAALTGLVEYPDELIVCQAPASEADRNMIQATLLAELDGRFTSLGSGATSGAVTVGLNPTEETLAAELVERYGAAVDVSVGALAYPLDDAEVVCGPTLEPSLIDGLKVSVLNAASPAATTPAGTVAITVRLTNTGDQTIHFSSGHPSTAITDAEGAPLTSDMRSVASVGIGITLDPGAHQDFDVDVALSSCDPSLGYLVPAGDHFVVVSFYNAELQSNMNSEPLPITIAD